MKDYYIHFNSLKTDATINKQLIDFYTGYLEGMELRIKGDYIESNRVLKELLKKPLNIPTAAIGFLHGTIQTTIGENYYNLEQYDSALNAFNVRFSIINAGGEITLGYSFLRRAKFCEKLENYDQALIYYDRFLELYEDSDPKYKDWVSQANEGRESILKMTM